MAGTNPETSHQEILAALTDEAKRLWGDARAVALKSYLENAAKQLGDTAQVLPEPEVEPGYYQ